MKKLKKLWNENRILIILGIILIVCILIIGIVSLVYFYGSSSSAYGDRLLEIEDVPISNAELKNIEDTLKGNDTVTSVSTTVKGKIVYLSINFQEDTPLDDAKSVAESVISEFSEEELALYDIMFTIIASSTSDDGYTLMGARNASGSGSVVWSNNTKVVEESSNE